jgi:hypothetical protein
MKFSVLLTAFALSLFRAALYAAAHSGIRVVVKGLRDDRGRVGCSLFKGVLIRLVIANCMPVIPSLVGPEFRHHFPSKHG